MARSGRRFVALMVLSAWLLAACAKREPPSGGPPDLTPPRLLSSFPDSGAAAVPLDTELSLTFSEAMEPRSTTRSVELAPRVEIQKRRWRQRTLSLIPAEPLEPGQTYTMFVAGTARDRHGNPFGTGAAVVFSTADSFPSGRIEGEIEALGFSAPGTYLWCYDAAAGREPDSTARDFDSLGLVDEESRFRIDGLAVPGRYRLWAFADLNANRSFESSTDILAVVDTVIELQATVPVAAGLRVRVVNPRTPGRVRGAVLDSRSDTAAVLRVLAVSERDSLRRVVAEIDDEGAFDLKLDPGPWLLRAFHDVNRNRSWQPAQESAGEAQRIEVQPAGDLGEIRLHIRRPSEEPGKR